MKYSKMILLHIYSLNSSSIHYCGWDYEFLLSILVFNFNNNHGSLSLCFASAPCA